jgi:dihydrodipicolinate synthase/N-acetylneuraminate lyase
MTQQFARRDFLLSAGRATLALPFLTTDSLRAWAPVEGGVKSFRGIFAILQTPFTLGDLMDEDDLEREVNFCVRGGAQGLVWPQLYGEFNVLSEAERLRGAEILLRTPRGASAAVIGVQAPNQEMAVRLARHAAEKGADAVISLPPYRGSVTLEAVADYYRAIAGAIQLPVFIQNSGGEWGPALPTDFVIRLAEENPRLGYVKEEISPVPHRLWEYVGSGKFHGIFSGNAGRNLLNELARGSSGTMPACEFVDVDVQIYDLAVAGKTPEARALFEKLLPMINLEETYGVGFAKEVLVRRRIFKTAKRRGIHELKVLDSVDEQELEGWWRELAPYLKPSTSGS